MCSYETYSKVRIEKSGTFPLQNGLLFSFALEYAVRNSKGK